MHHLQQFDAHTGGRSVRRRAGDGEGLVGVGNGRRIAGVFLGGLFALFGLGLAGLGGLLTGSSICCTRLAKTNSLAKNIKAFLRVHGQPDAKQLKGEKV